jgi:hypothetical protein
MLAFAYINKHYPLIGDLDVYISKDHQQVIVEKPSIQSSIIHLYIHSSSIHYFIWYLLTAYFWSQDWESTKGFLVNKIDKVPTKQIL